MPPSSDWKEVVLPDEVERFTRHAEELGAMQRKRANGSLDRALHAKANAGVLAEFEVLQHAEGDAAAEARVGMFSEPRVYPALVRFSNGSGRRDTDLRPDVRGIAVKVIGVGGKKLIPGMEDAKTQDFLAIDTPTVPVRDADEFLTLVRAASTPALAPFKLLFGMGFGRSASVIKALLASAKRTVLPPAETTYFSALPIQYGLYAVHFAFFPIEERTEQQTPSVRGAGPNWLGDDLAARLRKGPLRYDFRVQFFQNASKTPIEDASAAWREADAPFLTVGRLTLLEQDTKSPRGQRVSEVIEKLSFDPWHAREDLRPLGNMMRARNHAYRVSTQARGVSPEPDAMPSFEGVTAAS